MLVTLKSVAVCLVSFELERVDELESSDHRFFTDGDLENDNTYSIGKNNHPIILHLTDLIRYIIDLSTLSSHRL
jgi:hypothetical protein